MVIGFMNHSPEPNSILSLWGLNTIKKKKKEKKRALAQVDLPQEVGGSGYIFGLTLGLPSLINELPGREALAKLVPDSIRA